MACYIDKTSNTELSEAINSLFAWYRDCEVCYVYLEDLDSTTLLRPLGPHNAILGPRWQGWAATRQTTRPEDMPYCLLGIFHVNMPLVYGEGTNAFLRLQEVIALATGDLSLFAWSGPSASGAGFSRALVWTGSVAAALCLLPSPGEYRGSA